MNNSTLNNTESFVNRHVGSNSFQVEQMLNVIGFSSMDSFIDSVVPASIWLKKDLDLPLPKTETEALAELKEVFSKNKVFRSYIGLGYYGCITPGVIQRNILENPSWYTSYTPYQAEISQGRLEALLNYQTMVMDLTGFSIANASLLDEATAVAEAMNMCWGLKEKDNGNSIFISEDCFLQTIDVVKTRSKPIGVDVEVGDTKNFVPSKKYFAVVLQYPTKEGAVYDYQEFISKVKAEGVLVIMAADLLSLALLKPPAELGADVAVGSSQRFGVPMGYGGPHAAYMATHDKFKRSLPGRLIGVSKDSRGQNALRLSLQTREQHIRRDKATSNICTAQVLLAIMASMYSVYHGQNGIRAIAESVHQKTAFLYKQLKQKGFAIEHDNFFDTICIRISELEKSNIRKIAESKEINFNYFFQNKLCISVDETVTEKDLKDILEVLIPNGTTEVAYKNSSSQIPEKLKRTSSYLTHPVFNTHNTETKMLRYIKMLEHKDISLADSMIPLGSCTMKLNASSEMYPITWKEVCSLHPFVPKEQAIGFSTLVEQLSNWLKEVTGFAAISLQPNAGSQGEYAGLLAIRNFYDNKKESHRDVCLIPVSAHGTNPASAVMAGFKVVPVACDSSGNIEVSDLKNKAEQYRENLAAIMITYPSTHGVFEEGIKEVCEIVHRNGGQVYMDGANMNAQVGLCRPADIGADVCHLNLHKTFSIPHGGGGPGVGPIGVGSHLVPFLPGHSVVENGTGNSFGAVSAAPYGSAAVLPISWMYIRMLGSEGLAHSTKMAILNANYVAKKLENYFPILYKGKSNLVAHECILDARKYKALGVEVDDIAKRLIDYGFHAPTMSWPVPGTLMVEPTESESIEELDRFCSAMVSIYEEIKDIESGKLDKLDNPLKNAPHTADVVISDSWNRAYPRERAAYPLQYLRERKYWPSVGRVDNAYGDRNLVCACLPVESYSN